MLSTKYNTNYTFEIGIDEAGRGPLFGRLYVAAVVLPKDILLENESNSISIDSSVSAKKSKKSKLIGWNMVKDSKKIKNKETMIAISDYIKQHAHAWAIHYIEHDVIDKINIRQAVFQGMHECIKQVIDKLEKQTPEYSNKQTFLLVDGNDFKPYSIYDETNESLYTIPYETIEGGDNTYMAIAAASILAKCARDTYIDDLCNLHTELKDRYNIHNNMGYGTKAHLDGIVQYGITQWHRISYGRCKEANLCHI